MVGLLVALLLAAPAVVLSAAPAQACRCAASGVQQQVRAADLVVAGTVLDVREVERRAQRSQPDRRGQQGQQDRNRRSQQDQQRGRGDVRLVVGVDQVYEGRLPDATIDVTTALEPSLCGLGRVETDQRYFFFLDAEGAVLRATSCNGTAPADSEQADAIRAVLGDGTPVGQVTEPTVVERTLVADPGEPHPVLAAAPGGVLAVVGLVGLVVLGRVRPRR